MLIKGQDVSNIAFGNTLSEDGHAGRTFDYMLANPPFGVEWKKVEKTVRDEHEQRGYRRIFAWQPPAKRLMDDMGLGFDLHLRKMNGPSRRFLEQRVLKMLPDMYQDFERVRVTQVGGGSDVRSIQ